MALGFFKSNTMGRFLILKNTLRKLRLQYLINLNEVKTEKKE